MSVVIAKIEATEEGAIEREVELLGNQVEGEIVVEINHLHTALIGAREDVLGGAVGERLTSDVLHSSAVAVAIEGKKTVGDMTAVVVKAKLMLIVRIGLEGGIADAQFLNQSKGQQHTFVHLRDIGELGDARG